MKESGREEERDRSILVAVIILLTVVVVIAHLYNQNKRKGEKGRERLKDGVNICDDHVHILKNKKER